MSLELLSPAGSYNALLAAIANGANAVYFGLNGFNARVKAENCRNEEIDKWLDTCHVHGVKAYVAVNTLLKDEELPQALNQVWKAYECGADAFIVQDYGLAACINAYFPEAALHLSTQAGIGSALGAKALSKNLRFTRIILPRECGKREVAELVASGYEIEIFAHGALCVAFSGNCYFSSIAAGNSGNRGRCQQFCRTPFRCGYGNGKETAGYLLSTKDLCLIQNMRQLSNLGVTGIKLEGRMKRPEYVAEVTRCYRRAIDGETIADDDIHRLKAVYNRGGFTRGYLFDGGEVMYKAVQGHLGLAVGKVTGVFSGRVAVQCKRTLSAGDGFKIITEGLETGSALFDCAGTEKNIYYLRLSGKAAVGSAVHITTDRIQLEGLDLSERKEPLSFLLTVAENACPALNAKACGVSVTVKGKEPSITALNAPLKREEVTKQLAKLGDTPFYMQNCAVSIDGSVFLKLSAINELRRDAVKALCKQILQPYRRKAQNPVPLRKNVPKYTFQREIALILSKFEQYNTTMTGIVQYFIYDPDDFNLTVVQKNAQIAALMYLKLPYYLSASAVEAVRPLLRYFYGVYACNPYAIQLAREEGVSVFYGELNIMNAQALDLYLADGGENAALSREITYSEALKLIQYSEKLRKAPFLPVFGAIPLMQLAHCPVQNVSGCTCRDCKYTENFCLKDGGGRLFPVRRQRAKGCFFTLYNNLPQNALSKILPEGVSYLMDMRGFGSDEILDTIINIADNKTIRLSSDSTGGLLYRGVK